MFFFVENPTPIKKNLNKKSPPYKNKIENIQATSPHKIKFKKIITMQLLQNCIGPTIRIGQEFQCLQYAGLF